MKKDFAFIWYINDEDTPVVSPEEDGSFNKVSSILKNKGLKDTKSL